MSHEKAIHEVKASKARRPRAKFNARATAASAAALALALGGATGAQAAVGDSAAAEGQFISGSLLDSLAVEDLASLGGVSAANDGLSPDDEQSEGLDVDVLSGLVSIDVGGGLELPVNFVASELGAIDQYAFAGSDATAIGAAGLISDDGAIEEIGGDDNPPTVASIELSNLLGDDFTDAITDLNLNLGAVSASAQVDEGGVPYGDYQIAGADLTFDSPLLAEITDELDTTVVALEPTIDAAVGSSGLVDAVLTDLTDLITAVVPGVTVDATAALDVDLSAIVDGLIDEPLTSSSGATTVDLGTGTVTVDLQELVGLNGLDPDTDILDDVTLGLIVGEVGNITDGLMTDIVESVNTALEDAEVTLDITTELAGVPAPAVTIAGTLGDLATGASDEVAITTAIGGLDVGAVATTVLPLLQGPASDLLDTIDGTLATLGTTLDTAPEPLLTELSGVIELVDEVVQLTANVQSPVPALQDEAFEVIGLQISLLDTELSTIPTALELNLAHGLVMASAGDPATGIALDPDEGPLTGGNDVVITGTDLGPDPTVTVDGADVPAADVTVNPDDSVTIVMPPAALPGPVDVTVDNGNGQSEPATYTYLADPDAATGIALDPDEGPLAGGNDVVITGTDLGDDPTVIVDGAPVDDADVTVNPDDSVTIVMPPGTLPGPVDVSVDNGNGPSVPATYTYLADPDAATGIALDPDEGPLAGGNDVVISGTDLGDDPTVIVDGADVPAGDVTVNLDGTITIVMPPGTLPGPVDVSVDNGNGPSIPATYTYLAGPDAATDIVLDPDEGPLEGGNDVVISGTDLGDDPTVIVDGTPVDDADVTVNPDGTITIVMPPGTLPGPVDVNVDNGNGPSEPATYLYLADTPGDDEGPVITDVVPDSGPTDGGTTVIVEGDNFDIVTEVTIDGVPVDWQLQDDGSITFITPPHAAGTVAIILSSASGDAVAYFTYEAGTVPGTDPPGGLAITGATVPTELLVVALLLLAAGGGLALNAIRKRRSQA